MHNIESHDTHEIDRHYSAVHFKRPNADLHRLSKFIFLISLAVSIGITVVVLVWPLPEHEHSVSETIPTVVMLVESIPETHQRIDTPAPPAPFSPSAAPIPVDDILPDDVTIEDTMLELDTPPALPLVSIPEGAGDDEALEAVYEYYAVEEAPERLANVVPVYPPIAVRAGIGGTVNLKVLVNTEGIVDSVAVLDGPELLLDSAIEAAQATTFTPARHLDRPVACWVLLPFRFTPPR